MQKTDFGKRNRTWDYSIQHNTEHSSGSHAALGILRCHEFLYLYISDPSGREASLPTLLARANSHNQAGSYVVSIGYDQLASALRAIVQARASLCNVNRDTNA